MPSMLVAALSLLPLAGHPPQLHSERVRAGAWTLEVWSDAFSGQASCRLQTRPRPPWASYEREVLVVHFPARVDTSNAVYRIDDGPATWSHANDVEMAMAGVAIHDDGLVNPSGGLVRIPARLVMDARVLRVRAGLDSAPVVLNLDGLRAAVAAAAKSKCIPA